MLQFELATTDEIASEFGDRLRAHRLTENLQQSELAARAGVSERALRNFERSGRGSFDLFLRVAMALGLIESMSNLFELKPKSIKAMEQVKSKAPTSIAETNRMKKLNVIYMGWGERFELGVLADDGRDLLFEYSPQAIERGLELSPFKLPLSAKYFGDFPDISFDCLD